IGWPLFAERLAYALLTVGSRLCAENIIARRHGVNKYPAGTPFPCLLLSTRVTQEPLPHAHKREPMTESVALPVVHLKIERRSSHPWIFQKMVEKPAMRLPPGSVVDILDRDGKWVGRGFYNGHSRIALRVLTSDPA